MTCAGTAWRPQRKIELVAGTPPGGGLDRSARALIKAIESLKLLDVPVEVVNIPGDGARKAWTYVEQHAGDPHVLSISSPNLTTDHLVGLAAFDHSSFTPLAILYTEYLAFVARADSPIKSGADLMRRLGDDAGSITVALSTAKGNPNHIALAQVTRHTGGDVRAPHIRVFDSALDAVADVAEGHADIGVITAASAVKELAAGRVRALAVSSPGRLPGLYEKTPTWAELSVDCTIGAWRGITGARELKAEHIVFWENIFSTATAGAEWDAELVRHYWTRMYLDGAPLREFLQRERAGMGALLEDLGLLKQASP